MSASWPAPFDALVARCDGFGLNVAVGLGEDYMSAVAEDLRLTRWYPEARGAILLCSGGDAFFQHFTRAEKSGDDPMDDWTRSKVGAELASLRAQGIGCEVRYPFFSEEDPVNFQRVALAAGLGAPSLLGLVMHPTYGPWIAMRALVLLDRPMEPNGRVDGYDPCPDCEAPCVTACPGTAVNRERGLDWVTCRRHRLGEDDCHDACASRVACPEGAEARYSADGQAFFQRLRYRDLPE